MVQHCLAPGKQHQPRTRRFPARRNQRIHSLSLGYFHPLLLFQILHRLLITLAVNSSFKCKSNKHKGEIVVHKGAGLLRLPQVPRPRAVEAGAAPAKHTRSPAAASKRQTSKVFSMGELHFREALKPKLRLPCLLC